MTTLEGNTFCITGSTRMFYVNSIAVNTFDPRPSKAIFEATTLVALLQKISPMFKKSKEVYLNTHSLGLKFVKFGI